MPINAADFEAVDESKNPKTDWGSFEAVPDPKALATGVGESLDLTNRVLSTLAAGAIPSEMGQAQGKRIRAEQLQSLAQRAGAMAGGGNVSPSGVPLAAEDMAGVSSALSQGPFSLVPQEGPGPKGGGPLGGVLGMRQEVPGALPSGDIAANIGLPKPPGLYDDTVQGVGESLLGTADFMLSPIGISTLGIGALPRLAQRAVALAFAGQMAHQTPEIARELGTEFGKNPEDRDNAKIAKLITDAATTTGFTVAGGLHGLAPGADIPAPGLQRLVDRSVQGPTATGDQFSMPTGAPAPRLEPPPGLDLNSPEEAAAQAEAMNRNATASFGPRGNPQPQVPRLAKPEVPEGPSDPRVTEIQQQGLGTINEILQEYPALKGNRSAARELRNLAFPELKGKPDNATRIERESEHIGAAQGADVSAQPAQVRAAEGEPDSGSGGAVSGEEEQAPVQNEAQNVTASEPLATPTKASLNKVEALQPSADRVNAASHLSGDLASGQALADKGFESLVAERQKAVLAGVRTALHDDKIFNAVVQAIPVDVVNNLTGQKGATKLSLKDKAMLLDKLPAALAPDATVGHPVSRFVDSMLASPEVVKAISVTKAVGHAADLGGLAEEGASAEGASSVHEPTVPEKAAAGQAQATPIEAIGKQSASEFFDTAKGWQKEAMEGKGVTVQERAEQAARENPDLKAWQAAHEAAKADAARILGEVKADPSKIMEREKDMMGAAQKSQFFSEGIKEIQKGSAPPAVPAKPVDVESHLKAEAPKPEELTRARDWLKTLNEQSSEIRTERDKVEAEAKALRDSISTTRGSYRSFGGKRVARIKASASKGDVVKLRDLERRQTDLSVQLQRIDEQKRPHQIVVDKNVDAELINNPKAPLIRRLDRVVRKLEDAKTPNPQLRQALDDETARVIKERYPDATPEEIKGLSNEVQRQAYFGDDIWGDKGMGQIPSLFEVRKERVRQAQEKANAPTHPSEELQGKIDRYNQGAPKNRTTEATDELIKAINEDAEAGRAKVAADAKAAQEKEAKAKAEEDKLIEEAQAQADSLPKSGSKGGPTAKAVRDELVRRVSAAMEKLTADDKTTLEKRADGSYVAQSGEGGGIAFGEIEPTEGGRFVVTARQPGGSKTSHRFTVKTVEEAQTIIKALASSQPGRAIIGVPGDGVFKINRSGEALLRVFKGARGLDVNPGGEGLKDRPSDLRPSATSIGPVERALAKLEAEATKARARLKGKEGGTTFGSGPLHELPNIRDYAIIGAAKLARYGLDKARFAAEMVDEFGKRISKHIDRLFEESKVLLARHQEIERNKATPIQQIIGEATGAASAKPSTVGQIIDTLQTGLKTVRALKDHFTDAPKISRVEVKVADDFLEADANRIRESLGDYVKANLPVAERGRFLTAIGNATRRSPLLTGDPEAMYRRAATVAARIEDRATEVKRNDAVNAIKDNVAKALASPTVDLRFKSAIGDLVKNFTFTRPTEATIAKLRSIREYIASQEALGRDVEMPKAILESLEILNKTPIKDLPVHVLEAMRDRIALLEEMGRRTVATRQLRWENEKAAKNRELANEPTNPLDKRPQFTRGLVEGPDMAQKIGNFIRRQLDNGGLIDKALLPIDALFDLLGDAKGAYKGWLFKNVRNPLDLGFNAAVVMRDRITKPLVDLIKQHNLDDKSARRIGVYAALQQEGGRDRMLAMGAKPEELAQLERSLSPAERAAYKVMRTALDQLLPQVQKLMHELYNIPVEPVENYFPMPRDWSKVEVDPEAPAEPKFGEERSFDDLVGWRDMAGDYSPRTTRTEQGMTIERLKGAESAIKIHAFDVFEQNVNDVAHLLSTQRDIKQIGELAKGDLFIEKYGKLGQSMVLNWLDTVARQGKLGGFRRWNMLDVLRKNTSAGVIGFRLASQFVHLSNVPLAMERTGVNNYRSGLVAALTEKGQQFLKDNFAETYARGGGEPALVEAMNEGSSVFGKQIVPKRFVKAGFAIAREIDQKNSQATVLGMYFRALKEKGIDPSQYADLPVDKEAQARALVMARRAVASPLPKDVPMALSRGALSGGNLSVGRAMFQFQNIFLDQWSNIRHDLARAGIREALLKNGDPIKAIRTAAALTAMIIAETGIREASKQAIQSATGNKPKHEMPTEGKVAIETLRRFPFMGQATAAVLHNGSGVPLLDSVLDVPRAAYSAITAKGMKGQDRAKIRAISGAAQLMGVPGASQLGEIAEKSL